MGESRGGPKEGDTPAEEEFIQRLAEDSFYRAFASTHRRRILYYLLEENDSTLEELATVLSGWDANPKTMRSPEYRMELLSQLHHNHLPQLDDAGLVEFDPQTGSAHLEPLDHLIAEIIRQSVLAEEANDL